LIECVSEVERPSVRNLLGVFTLQVALESDVFWAASELEQKRGALEVLHRGVLRVAEIEQWRKDPFEVAYGEVVNRAYANEWTWPRPRRSADRKHFAILFCAHNPDSFRAWIVVSDKEHRELSRVLVIDDEPNDFIFVPKLGKLTWVSDSRVALFGRDGEEIGALTLLEGLPTAAR